MGPVKRSGPAESPKAALRNHGFWSVLRVFFFGGGGGKTKSSPNFLRVARPQSEVGTKYFFALRNF